MPSTTPNGPSPDHDRIGNLFHRASALPPAEREAFVRREAADDPLVAEQALRRLAYADAPSERLRATVSAATSPAELDEDNQAQDPEDPVQPTPTAELLQKLAQTPRLDARRFAFERLIGEGGMGVVYRVHDKHLNRQLAVKLVLPENQSDHPKDRSSADDVLGRFLEEAQVTSQLDHPGVIPVHELGLDQNGDVFFMMRQVKGRTASKVFADAHARRNDWSLTRALEVVLKVCDTMSYAHARGVLHRDLKPKNVMVGRFGEVYVLDWGVAKVRGQADRHNERLQADAAGSAAFAEPEARGLASTGRTRQGSALGTPNYMSPEQARGDFRSLDERTDVYAIGAMLYQLLTGAPPYAAGESAPGGQTVRQQVIAGPPPSVESLQPGVPAELVAIVGKAMARDREQRYGNTASLAADVRAFLSSQVVSAYRTGALVELQLWVKRNKPLAASLACLSLVLGLAVALTTNLNRLQREQLRDSAWGAFNQASRLFASADKEDHPVNSAIPAAEALLQSTRALLFDPTNGVAWERFAIEVAARADLWPQPIAILPTRGRPNTVAFNSDATLAATTSSRGQLAQVWDLVSGRERFSLQHQGVVWLASFSPDGTRVVTGSQDWTAKVWDTRTGSCLLTLPHGADVIRAAFDHNGSRLLTGDLGSVAKLWDAATGRELLRLTHEGEVYCVAFHAEGSRLLTSGGDTAALWDAESGQRLRSFKHDALVTSATFDRDGLHVLTGSFDNTVKLWDTATGGLLRTFEGGYYGTGFSPEGSQILTSILGDHATLRSIKGDRIVTLSDAGHGRGPVMSGDGTRILTSGRRSADLWDAATGSRLSTWAHQGIEDFAISPDGLLALTGGDSDTRLWRMASRPTGRMLCHDDITSAALSDDHAYALTGSGGGTAKLWRVESARHLRTFDHGAAVKAVDLSSDGSLALTAGDKFMMLWSTATGDIVHRLPASESIRSARLSRDGGSALTVCDDDRVRLWNVASGTITRSLHHDGPIRVATFSRDGRRVLTASGDRTARVWNAATGAEIRRLQHEEPVLSAAFAPDEESVLTASGDNSGIRKWSAGIGGTVHALLQAGNFEEIHCDGGHILTRVGWQTRIWDFATAKPLRSFAMHPCRATTMSADGMCVLVAGPSFARLHDISLACDVRRAATEGAVECAIAMSEELTNRTLSVVSELDPLGQDRLRVIRQVRQRNLGGSDPLSQLARWLASSGPEAPAFPDAPLTSRQYADALIANGGLDGAREVLRFDPGHPLVHIALAAYETAPPGDNNADHSAAAAEVATRQDFLRDFDLIRLPRDAQTRASAATMLLVQGDKARALQAADMALAIDPTNSTALRVKAEAGR
jgi:WD40 repeat protein/serine/threonine protein kinase